MDFSAVPVKFNGTIVEIVYKNCKIQNFKSVRVDAYISKEGVARVGSLNISMPLDARAIPSKRRVRPANLQPVCFQQLALWAVELHSGWLSRFALCISLLTHWA